jgi:hypothetical protein
MRSEWILYSRGHTTILKITGVGLIDTGHYEGFADIPVENGYIAGIVEGRATVNGKPASNNRQS